MSWGPGLQDPSVSQRCPQFASPGAVGLLGHSWLWNPQSQGGVTGGYASLVLPSIVHLGSERRGLFWPLGCCGRSSPVPREGSRREESGQDVPGPGRGLAEPQRAGLCPCPSLKLEPPLPHPCHAPAPLLRGADWGGRGNSQNRGLGVRPRPGSPVPVSSVALCCRLTAQCPTSLFLFDLPCQRL